MGTQKNTSNYFDVAANGEEILPALVSPPFVPTSLLDGDGSSFEVGFGFGSGAHRRLGLVRPSISGVKDAIVKVSSFLFCCLNS